MSSGLGNISGRGIYSDLMRKFCDEGHKVYIVFPCERREGQNTALEEHEGIHVLRVKTLNLQKTSVVEKGIGQLLLGSLFKRAMRKYFKGIGFDLILYSTPPITFTGIIKAEKRRNPRAVSYLLLKDIFPQNAVDMGLLSKTGAKGMLYKMFRRKEKELYRISDFIGCMSPANVHYVLEHNPEVCADKVEMAPNSIELLTSSNFPLKGETTAILDKYGLPTDRPIFIYGGNLGIPQGIPFLMKCLEANADREDCHFVVVGTGTYYQRLADWYKARRPKAVTVMKGLSKADYDQLVRACQVGLIFLDYRFTIPNFPSRLLSYLEFKMPIIACTDSNCDTGAIAEENGFGLYAPSNDVEAFTAAVNHMLTSDIKAMGERGYEFLKSNYLVQHTYDAIIKHVK